MFRTAARIITGLPCFAGWHDDHISSVLTFGKANETDSVTLRCYRCNRPRVMHWGSWK